MTQQTHGGTALPWAAFALGAAGSLAANLLDAVDAVTRAANGVPVDWPELSAALFFATLVPVALLLVVEMLIRSGKDQDGLAAVMWIGAALVALGAAVMSMGHMYKVMIGLGQPPLFAALMPLAVDGLMLVASVALARAGRSANAVAVPVSVTAPEAAPLPSPSVPVDVPADVPAVPVPVPVPEEDEVQANSVPEPLPMDVPTAPVSVPEANEDVPVRSDVPNLVAAGDVNEEARAFVRSALKEGRKVNGPIVGTEFGRSARWGQFRVAEVKKERAAVPA